MAVNLIKTRPTRGYEADLHGRGLERIVGATLKGRSQVAAAVADCAGSVLMAEGAAVLLPDSGGNAVRVTSSLGGGLEETWQAGPAAAQLLERPAQTSDAWREPWAALRMYLTDLGMRSWTTFPMKPQGCPDTLGLLVVGARGSGRPCGRMDRIPALAAAAAAALAATPETERTGAPWRADETLDRLETLGKLIFGVSHSLGNILGSMMANLHLLRLEEDGATSADLLDRLEHSTGDGIKLMRALQSWTTPPGVARQERVDLSAMAAKTAWFMDELCRRWPGSEGVRVDSCLAESCVTWGNRGMLRECLLNLVLNAVQAVGHRGRITIRTVAAGEIGEVRVSDDGPGMSREVQRRAAEPFFTTSPAEREGLGLAVARGIAVAHRGSLTFGRGELGGTEVAVRLPREATASESLAAMVNAVPVPAASVMKGAA